MGENALRADADLAGVGEAGRHDGVRGLVQIGVRQHDDGRVAAELHRDFLQPRHAADGLADVAAPGEADLADARIRAEPAPDFAAGAGHDLDGLRRQARVQQHLGELQRHQRGVRGGLENGAVAGRERGADLVAYEVEREVERRHCQHHAARHAQREAEAVAGGRRPVQRHDFRAEPLGLFGRADDGFSGAVHFEAGLGDDLALF